MYKTGLSNQCKDNQVGSYNFTKNKENSSALQFPPSQLINAINKEGVWLIVFNSIIN